MELGGFFSSKFKGHRLNISPEKETLVMLLPLNFRNIGRIQLSDTDHRPLVIFVQMCNHNQRLMSWALLVHRFTTDQTAHVGADAPPLGEGNRKEK